MEIRRKNVEMLNQSLIVLCQEARKLANEAKNAEIIRNKGNGDDWKGNVSIRG